MSTRSLPILVPGEGGGAGVAKIMRGAHLAFRFDFIVVGEWRVWSTRQLVLYLGLLYRY